MLQDIGNLLHFFSSSVDTSAKGLLLILISFSHCLLSDPVWGLIKARIFSEKYSPILDENQGYAACVQLKKGMNSTKIAGIRVVFPSKCFPDETSNRILHWLLVCQTKHETNMLAPVSLYDKLFGRTHCWLFCTLTIRIFRSSYYLKHCRIGHLSKVHQGKGSAHAVHATVFSKTKFPRIGPLRHSRHLRVQR